MILPALTREPRRTLPVIVVAGVVVLSVLATLIAATDRTVTRLESEDAPIDPADPAQAATADSVLSGVSSDADLILAWDAVPARSWTTRAEDEGLLYAYGLLYYCATGAARGEGQTLAELTEPDQLTGQCVTDALVEAQRRHGHAAAMDALAVAIFEFPKMRGLCHEAAHVAGSIAWANREPGTNAAEFIQTANTTCLMGFTHGVLDGLALEGATAEDLLAAAKGCYWEEAGGHLAMCYDGIGHAVWHTTRDLESSVEVCASAAAAEQWTRHVCETGILMQMFEPAHLEATYRLEDSLVMLPEMCETWPQVTGPDHSVDPRAGCWWGAAYLVHAMINALISDQENPPLSEMDWWIAALRDIAQICLEQTEIEGQQVCSQAYGIYLHEIRYGQDFDTKAAWCEALEPWRTYCLFGLGEGMASASGRMADGTVMSIGSDSPRDALEANGFGWVADELGR